MAALAAAAVAAYVIVQGRKLHEDRARDRRRERLQDRLTALEEAVERLTMLVLYVNDGKFAAIEAEQRRLRVVALRAAAESTAALIRIADYPSRDAVLAKTGFLVSISDTTDLTIAEIGRLASEVDAAY